MDTDPLRQANHPLLADFLDHAPESHRYAQAYEQYDDISAFLARMDEFGDVAKGLLANDLGQAAQNADFESGAILLEMVNASTRYAVVTEDRVGTGFQPNTVPSHWAERIEKNT